MRFRKSIHVTQFFARCRDMFPSIVGYCILTVTVFCVILLVRFMFFMPTRPHIPEGSMESVLLPHKQVQMTFSQKKDPDFDVQKAMEELNLQRVAPDHKTLVDIIRNYYIEMPTQQPYQLDDPDHVEYFYGQNPYLDERLKYQNSRFFVESRAFEGEENSPSLFFEKYRKWNGILIEPNPNLFEKIRKKRRKCFIMNACIHDQPYPGLVTIQTPDVKESSITYTGVYSIQCFPLLSVLLALQVHHVTLLSVNFFGINANGQNKQHLLENLPSDKIKFEFITLHDYLPRHGDPGAIATTLEAKRFELLERLSTSESSVSDWVFHNKDMAIPNPVFWTWTNIFRAIFIFVILYLIANVVVYKLYFKRTLMYQRMVG